MNTKRDAARRHAEERAGMWLHQANLASEKGQKEKAERLYEKAGKWLDRANVLLGWGDGSN